MAAAPAELPAATLVLDISGIVALYDASAAAHDGAVEAVRVASIRLVPAAILAEVDYMLGVRLAPQAALDFLQAVESRFFMIEPFIRADASYCRALIGKYASLQLGLADAAVMAVAERHRAADVLSLDRRHFDVVRPAAFTAFRLWPVLGAKAVAKQAPKTSTRPTLRAAPKPPATARARK